MVFKKATNPLSAIFFSWSNVEVKRNLKTGSYMELVKSGRYCILVRDAKNCLGALLEMNLAHRGAKFGCDGSKIVLWIMLLLIKNKLNHFWYNNSYHLQRIHLKANYSLNYQTFFYFDMFIEVEFDRDTKCDKKIHLNNDILVFITEIHL